MWLLGQQQCMVLTRDDNAMVGQKSIPIPRQRYECRETFKILFNHALYLPVREVIANCPESPASQKIVALERQISRPLCALPCGTTFECLGSTIIVVEPQQLCAVLVPEAKTL